MPTPRDPYRNFRFTVEIAGTARAGFSEISGLGQHEIDVIEYREGGEIDTPRKMPGLSKFGDVTFKRGLSDDVDFANWMLEIFNLNLPDGTPPTEGWRRMITVNIKNKAGDVVRAFTMRNCWPKSRTLGDLNATSSEVLMTELVVCHEGFEEVVIPGTR